VTGTDEHGLKMAQTARERGVTPAALAEEMSTHFKDMGARLNISFDRFIRTTEPDHHRSSQAIWQAMVEKGDLYLGRYEGWYSVRDEAYYDEKELVVADTGERLSPQGTEVEWTVEESWFFRLSAYGDRLLRHYERNPDFIRPDARRNEVLRFVEGGLADLSVSRTSFDWGVKVPGSDDHVMYVWLDALTNYITGVGYPDTESKSLGNVIDPLELVDRFGVDQLRYFLLRDVSFGQDGSYSAEAIVNRCNADLANSFGNLAQRTLSFIAKNCGGALPLGGKGDPADEELLATVRQATRDDFCRHFASLAPGQAIEAWLRAVFACNQYIDAQAPWSLRKTDPERMTAVLATLVRAIRSLAIAIRPVVPASADRLLDQLGVPAEGRDHADLADESAYERLAGSGFNLAPPTPIFPKLEMPADA
jgi:methionyl-tRNA synthetase